MFRVSVEGIQEHVLCVHGYRDSSRAVEATRQSSPIVSNSAVLHNLFPIRLMIKLKRIFSPEFRIQLRLGYKFGEIRIEAQLDPW